MYPLVVTNPFIDDFPIKTSIYKGFSMVMLNNQRVNLTALRMNMEPVEMVSWQGLHPHFGGIPRWSHLLHVGWGAPATIHAARNSLVPSWVASSTLWKSLRKMTSSVPWQHGPGCLLIPISRWSQRLKQRRRSRSYSPLFHQQSVVPAVACWFMSRIYRYMTHRGLIGRVTEPLCHHGMEEPGCESLWITNSLRSAKHCQNIWGTFFKVFCRGEGRRWKTIGKLKPMEKHPKSSNQFQPSSPPKSPVANLPQHRNGRNVALHAARWCLWLVPGIGLAYPGAHHQWGLHAGDVAGVKGRCGMCWWNKAVGKPMS